jgi:calcineurin-like phosphoesterase
MRMIIFVIVASDATILIFQVLHNMAITESFLDGCPDPKKLIEVLRNVKVSESCIVIFHSDLGIERSALCSPCKPELTTTVGTF